MLRSKTFFILLVAVLVAALPAAALDTGDADFTNFVALGDSLGAGFTAGGLVRGAQVNSVPALVARQATTTSGPIRQALMDPPGIPPLLRLVSISPLVIQAPPLGQPSWTLDPLHQNLSVPGFDVGDALRHRDRDIPADILAALILAAPPTIQPPPTQLELAIAQQPTFAMVWLGNNDVLGAAVSGRVIDGVTLTPPAQFEADYTRVVGALAQSGADLVLATLPDVTAIPYVTTVPPVVVDPNTSQPVLGPDGNPIPLLGPGGRPLPPGSRVLLPTTAKLAQGFGIPGTGRFLADGDYLSPAEIDAISGRVNTFNQIIRATASAVGAPVAEIGAVFTEAATGGINIGGITFTADFLTGGLISLDGIHPTPLGYAVAANEFIRVINDGYGGAIPKVDLFPFLFGADAFALPPAAATASQAGMIYTSQAGRQMGDVLNADRPSTTGDDGGPGRGRGNRDMGEIEDAIRDRVRGGSR